eukprot:1527368-Rhodomonas_salina.1
MASDNSYHTFDSYIAIDRQEMELVYEHNSLLSADKFTQWFGAAGLCRLHSIGMPFIKTNTHSVCTRQRKSIPNPALPWNRKKPMSFRSDLNERTHSDELFSPEACAAHSTDVLWTLEKNHHPLLKTVGGVNDFIKFTSLIENKLGRHINVTNKYPSQHNLLDSTVTLIQMLHEAGPSNIVIDKTTTMPLAGLPVVTRHDDNNNNDNTLPHWDGCAPPIDVVTCKVDYPETCPPSMAFVHSSVKMGSENGNIGVCLYKTENNRGQPCFRSDMC